METREAELLLWASEHVRKPWEKMVAVAAKCARGEPLTDPEQKVALPLTPFTADYRALYPLMKNFGGLITWSPNNLFTIILDADEKKILRAYIEVTRDHNFIELIPIDPNEPFMQEALSIIRAGDLYPLRRFLDEILQKTRKQRVNWVKIANIEFFGAFADQQAAFEASGDFWDWATGALKAVQKIYDKQWIRFTPEPPVFARQRELFSGILKLDPAHIDFKKVFGPIKAGRPASKETLILLADHAGVTGLSLGGNDPYHLTLDQNLADQFAGLPFHTLARACRKLTGVDRVIALRTEPVANLVYEALYNEMPYRRETTKTVLRKVLEIVRRFREQWTMDPLPFYLADKVRLPAKWLGNPFDINYLSSWFLPGMLIDGEAVFLGQHNLRTTVMLQGETIQAIYLMEFYDAGVRQVRTFDPALYADLFTGLKNSYEDTRERAVQLGIRLWNEGHGFQNQVTVVQTDFLKILGQLNSVSIWQSPFRLHRLIKPIRELRRMARAGAIVTYPDKMLTALEDWIKRVGRLHLYRPLITVPFDRQRPVYRGLKYIKGTVAILAITAVIALLIW